MVVIFDLDGTLIDSAPDICAAGNTVLVELGEAPMTLAEARGYIGSGAPVLIQRMRGARGLPDALQADMLARFLALYEDAVHLTTLYPGVADCLDGLAAAGHRMGICTNKPQRPTQSVLRHFDLSHHFDVVFGGDTLPVRKPDPTPLSACHAALGGGPVLFVGDSEVDAETALRAGMPFALFTEGYRKTPVEELVHEAAFSDFAALPGIVSAVAESLDRKFQ